MRVAFLFIVLSLLSCSIGSAKLAEQNRAVDLDKVKGLLEAKCATCHSPQGSASFLHILDREQLIKAGKLVPGDPDASRIYVRLNAAQNYMPPPPAPPLDIAEKELIRQYIAEGAKPLNVPTSELPYISPEDERRLCAQYLRLKVNEFDRPETQCVFFGSISNRGDQEALDAAHLALSKLLNHLSFVPEITPATKIDEYGRVMAFNFEDYGIKRKTFDNFLAASGYPYLIQYNDTPYFNKDEIEFWEKEIQVLTENYKTVSFIRADFFIRFGSDAPFYYDLLDLPDNLHDFEKLLFINKADQVRRQEAFRSVVRDSEVALHNRIIDRYELKYNVGPTQYECGYWQSSDTKTSEGNQNLFAFPFLVSDQIHKLIKTDKIAEIDANETIACLPNGNSLYFLNDGKGKRIDEATTDIVFDRNNLGENKIGNVAGGVRGGGSCIACHGGFGMRLYVDQLRPHVFGTGGFTNEEADVLSDLIFTPQALKTSLQEYVNDFTVAQTAVGISEVKYTSPHQEPIWLTSRRYQTRLSAEDLAAELYMPAEEVKDRLRRSQDLARRLGYNDDAGGFASRDNVEELFPEIIKEFNIGKVIKVGHVVNPPVKCKTVFTNKTNYPQRFDQIFAEKQYGQSWLNSGRSFEFDYDQEVSANGCLYYRSNYCVQFNQKFEKCAVYHVQIGANGYAEFRKTSQ